MDDRDPGLPIKLGPCSNGEYTPPPTSEVVREAVRRARAMCDDNARLLQMDRRRFLLSSMGAATTLAVLSALPVTGEVDPLSAEIMDAARRQVVELCGDGRVLVQGHAWPNVGEPQAALDAMRAESERFEISAWKTYTHVGEPFSLDDHSGVPVGER